jgi:hypothetical protein
MEGNDELDVPEPLYSREITSSTNWIEAGWGPELASTL